MESRRNERWRNVILWVTVTWTRLRTAPRTRAEWVDRLIANRSFLIERPVETTCASPIEECKADRCAFRIHACTHNSFQWSHAIYTYLPLSSRESLWYNLPGLYDSPGIDLHLHVEFQDTSMCPMYSAFHWLFYLNEFAELHLVDVYMYL